MQMIHRFYWSTKFVFDDIGLYFKFLIQSLLYFGKKYMTPTLPSKKNFKTQELQWKWWSMNIQGPASPKKHKKQSILQKLSELTLQKELWKTVKGLQQPGERPQIKGNRILTVTLALPTPLPSTTADLKRVTCVPWNCVFSFDLSMDSLRDWCKGPAFVSPNLERSQDGEVPTWRMFPQNIKCQKNELLPTGAKITVGTKDTHTESRE